MTIDLSPYAGGTCALSFEFTSDGSTTAEGWYLDDILVSGLPGPPNDLCRSAIPLTAGSARQVDTRQATSTDGTPSCRSEFGKGVWFTFTPAAAGPVTLSTCGSDFDTVLQVYTGDCESLAPVPEGCNDDNGPACTGPAASVRFPAEAGRRYFILAGGYAGAAGLLRIEANLTPTADLAVSMGAAPNPVPVASNLVYSILVTNRGPATATGVTLTDLLPPAVPLVWTTSSQGTCTPGADSVLCQLGSLPTSAAATVTVVLKPNRLGTLTNAVTLAANEPDPDPANNSARTTTAVVDLTAPIVLCPADIVVTNAPGQCDQIVTFAATATDNYDPQPAVTCEPPSGTRFPVGMTPVTCAATDASGNRATCVFTVTVLDREPPQIVCPANLVLDPDPGRTDRANVTYAPTATDNCPGVTLTVEPPSGSTFASGPKAVVCTARDAAGNAATCSFTITIRGVPPMITSQPSSRTNNVGDRVTFQVVALGLGPLSYQWYFNSYGLPDGAAATYVIPSVQPAQAGQYSVVVRDAFGSATSTPATLVLNLTNKIHRWTLRALDTALQSSAFVALEAELKAQGFAPLPQKAQVQWGFDTRGKDPRPICQAITVPFGSPAGSPLLSAVGVLLGIAPAEDGVTLGPPPLIGAIALTADRQGEQRTLRRVLCDTNGVWTQIETADEACFAGWFNSNWVNSTTGAVSDNTYRDMVAGLLAASEACAAFTPQADQPSNTACVRTGRWMGRFMFCALGICLDADGPPGGVSRNPDPEYGPPGGGGDMDYTGPPCVQGMLSGCDWDPEADAMKAVIVGSSLAAGVGTLGGLLVGIPIALFELNNDEAEWRLVSASQPYAVIEGVLANHKFAEVDSTFTHDSLDWCMIVRAYRRDEAWPGSPDYTCLASEFNETGGSMIECEWETDYLPLYIRTWPGDRIWMRGQLVFDCGHPTGPPQPGTGHKSEIHPPHALVTMRYEGAFLDSAPQQLPACVARVYISPWGGEANHPDDINTDGRVWSSGNGGVARFDRDHTPYRFKIPLPPADSRCSEGYALSPIWVRVEPVERFALPAFSTVTAGRLKIKRGAAANSYLQRVLNELDVSLWPPNATEPTHVEIRVPLTEKIPHVGGNISPIQFQIAVGREDAPMALHVKGLIPIYDGQGEHEEPGDLPALVVSPAKALPGGRTFLPPDRRTLLRVTGPDCAWQVKTPEVNFSRVDVFDDHDTWVRGGDGEWTVYVGANGIWRELPMPEEVNDGDPPYALDFSIPVAVWHPIAPMLRVEANGYERDGGEVAHQPDDCIGAVSGSHTALSRFGAGAGTQVKSSDKGDYDLDYSVRDLEESCPLDTYDPNDLPSQATRVSPFTTTLFRDLRLGPQDQADWFVIDADDYLSLAAAITQRATSASERCATYSLQIQTERAIIPPDRYDEPAPFSELCTGQAVPEIEKTAGRNDDWTGSPIIHFCPSAWALRNYDPAASAFVTDHNPPGVVLPALSFHLPYPGVSSTPDRDCFRIQLPAKEREQCGAPISGTYGCVKGITSFEAGLRVLIEGDRQRGFAVEVRNFDVGHPFVLQTPDSDRVPAEILGKGRSAIERTGPSSARVVLECPQASGRFPDGVVGLALRDPEGKRNFYDLRLTYTAEAVCIMPRLLQSPGWFELMRRSLCDWIDPMRMRVLPIILFDPPALSDPGSARGTPIAEGRVFPFIDLPEAGLTVRPDRWLMLLPKANALIDVYVEPPESAADFSVSLELRDLNDAVVGQAQLLADTPLGHQGAMLQSPIPTGQPATLHFRLDVAGLGGTFYTLKADPSAWGATYRLDFMFTQAPGIAVAPAELSFGSRCTGWAGPPRLLTLTNAGNADLTVSNIAVLGAGEASFRLTGLPTLPTTLPPASALAFGVSFRPASVSTSAAEVVVLSNDPKTSELRVGLSGVGTAQDTRAPELTVPTNLVVWTGTNGTTVTFPVMADDDCDAAVTVRCEPPAGSFLPVGTNTVTCSATDSAGRSTASTFTVRVQRDTEPPAIVCPASRTVDCGGSAGAQVFFSVRAADNSGTNVSVSATPASGSFFPAGTTYVNCLAVDSFGNRASRSFPVIVRDVSPPTLTVRLDGATVSVTWPVTCGEFTIESSARVEPAAAWTRAGLNPIVSAEGYVVSVVATNATQFYRLIRYP